MADDVTLNSMSGGPVVATDDSGTGHVQIVKLAQSGDGSRSPITADANGLAVVTTPGTVITSKTTTVGVRPTLGVITTSDTPTGLPAGYLGKVICASGDGRIQYISTGASTTTIYKSTDYGASWSAVTVPAGTYLRMACSDDGQYVVATGTTATGTNAITTTNGGSSWVTLTGYQSWVETAPGISADGSFCVFPTVGGAYVFNGNYLNSSSWTSKSDLAYATYVPSVSLVGACVSADGSVAALTDAAWGLYRINRFTGSGQTSRVIDGNYAGLISLSRDNGSLFVSSSSNAVLLSDPFGADVPHTSSMLAGPGSSSRLVLSEFGSPGAGTTQISGDGTVLAVKSTASKELRVAPSIPPMDMTRTNNINRVAVGSGADSDQIVMDVSGSTIYEPPSGDVRRRWTTTLQPLMPSGTAGKRISATVSNASYDVGVWVGSDQRVGYGYGVFVPPRSNFTFIGAQAVSELYAVAESAPGSANTTAVISVTTEAYA